MPGLHDPPRAILSMSELTNKLKERLRDAWNRYRQDGPYPVFEDFPRAWCYTESLHEILWRSERDRRVWRAEQEERHGAQARPAPELAPELAPSGYLLDRLYEASLPAIQYSGLHVGATRATASSSEDSGTRVLHCLGCDNCWNPRESEYLPSFFTGRHTRAGKEWNEL